MTHRLLTLVHPEERAVVMRRAEAAEVEALWAYVGKKHEPRWLWHAIGAP